MANDSETSCALVHEMIHEVVSDRVLVVGQLCHDGGGPTVESGGEHRGAGEPQLVITPRVTWLSLGPQIGLDCACV